MCNPRVPASLDLRHGRPRRGIEFARKASIAAALALLALTGGESTARADDDTPPIAGQRNVGLLLSGGQDGVAGGMRLGWPRVGLEIAGGYSPVIVYYDDTNKLLAPFGHLRVFPSAQGSASIYALPWTPSRRASLGFEAHYRYNSLLQSGAGGGFVMQIEISREFAMRAHFGLTYFPNGDEAISRQPGVADGQPLDPLFMHLQSAASFGIMWFPN